MICTKLISDDRIVYLSESKIGDNDNAYGHRIATQAKIDANVSASETGLVILDIEPVPTALVSQAERDAFWTEVDAAISKVRSRASGCRVGLYGIPPAEVNGMWNCHVYQYDKDHANYNWMTSNYTSGADKAGRLRDQKDVDGEDAYDAHDVDVYCPRIYSINRTNGDYPDDGWITEYCSHLAMFAAKSGKAVMPFIWTQRETTSGTWAYMSDADVAAYGALIKPFLGHFENVLLWSDDDEVDTDAHFKDAAEKAFVLVKALYD